MTRSGFWDFNCSECGKIVKKGGPTKERLKLCHDCKLEREDAKYRAALAEQAERDREEQMEPERLLERIEELEEKLEALEQRVHFLEPIE